MTELNAAQRSAIAGKHDTWLAGMYWGRASMIEPGARMTLDEVEAMNPYLIDGKDPLEGMRE